MKIACLSFTREGEKIARQIEDQLDEPVNCFDKSNYQPNLSRIFAEYEGIVFISSTGIAVRLSAPYLKDKVSDPAVVVVDDMARFAISLVSGHIGGANSLAEKIAKLLGCQPVITTASDRRGIESVDLFAKNNGYLIRDLKAVRQVTVLMLEGKRIKLTSPFAVRINYLNLVEENPDGCIYVTFRKKTTCSTPFCVLGTRILQVGVGCRKGKSADEIISAISQVFKANNLSLDCIQSLATIDLKKEESGIIEAGKKLECELKVFSWDDIRRVQHKFQPSAFVQGKIGVTAVSEPCAYLAGQEIIVNKTAINGVTIAVAT